MLEFLRGSGSFFCYNRSGQLASLDSLKAVTNVTLPSFNETPGKMRPTRKTSSLRLKRKDGKNSIVNIELEGAS
jgi:hypothetical protein